ncbi:glutamate-1-semialdehyde 2,1-aminomutase [Alkalibacter mobilis]|uniref:glutamate-1-semialdehyde 2,1-aminomutase n=1 Tax=Alkalibacter mobilis TaxID=2787712 RepID=UPI0018A070FB|nr:glutamate-1-semialdehyde 2,1-aminomutase [Alkalibacter mobilis]MBF7097168.1 glutamate-1-semialdehyde 2,1-aminomutase [Alkalibacter mobilis]
MKFTNSKSIYEKSKNYIPGGVNSPVRAFGSVGMNPIFAKEAFGSKIVDLDNNEFIDYISSWGPLILGHGSKIVHEGVEEVFQKGITYGLSTEKELKLAELITELYPSAEMVRMVNSGTEATMSAIRLARGYTGKEKILKFEGCYHGHYDGLLVKSGSGALTFNMPTSKGLTEGITKDTLVGRFNDIADLERIFDNFGNKIAGVIIEPVAGNMGVIGADEKFLKTLRKLTIDHGALLIFDEVITGFRLGLEGAAGYYGIKPDLVCFGKIIGGGLPVGAYGGKREIMKEISPMGGVYQAGTLSGNPLAVHMGYNLLNHLKNNTQIFKQIENMAKDLEKGLAESAQKSGKKVTVNRVGGMLAVFMNDGPVNSFEDVMNSDTKLFEKYFKGMLKRNILLPPSQFEGLFLSAAHSTEEIKYTIESSYKVFELI